MDLTNEDERQNKDISNVKNIKKLMEFDTLAYQNNIGSVIERVTNLWGIDQAIVDQDKVMRYIKIMDGMLQEGENKQRYKVIIEQLQKDIDQHFKEHVSNMLGDYLNLEEGWGEKLEKYVRDNKSEIYQSSGFLRQINIPILCEKIKESKPKDIDAFRD